MEIRNCQRNTVIIYYFFKNIYGSLSQFLATYTVIKIIKSLFYIVKEEKEELFPSLDGGGDKGLLTALYTKQKKPPDITSNGWDADLPKPNEVKGKKISEEKVEKVDEV